MYKIRVKSEVTFALELREYTIDHPGDALVNAISGPGSRRYSNVVTRPIVESRLPWRWSCCKFEYETVASQFH